MIINTPTDISLFNHFSPKCCSSVYVKMSTVDRRVVENLEISNVIDAKGLFSQKHVN